MRHTHTCIHTHTSRHAERARGRRVSPSPGVHAHTDTHTRRYPPCSVLFCCLLASIHVSYTHTHTHSSPFTQPTTTMRSTSIFTFYLCGPSFSRPWSCSGRPPSFTLFPSSKCCVWVYLRVCICACELYVVMLGMYSARCTYTHLHAHTHTHTHTA